MNRQLLAFLLGCYLAAEIVTATQMYFAYKTKFNGPVKLSYGFTQEVGLTEGEKQSILDMTNAARYRITTGQESNTPGGLAPNATNMMAVEWDDYLAAFAQNWADKCSSYHSAVPRIVKNYKFAVISENLSGPTLNVYTDMYGEVHGWTYVTQTCSPGRQCGHYNTLVSWANFRLGCGFRVCTTYSNGIPTREPNLVCEFAPYRAAGLVTSAPRRQFQYEYWTNLKPGVSYVPSQPASIMYAKTVPCSDCPQGWDYCMKGGLCATKRQCDTDAGNNGCVCNTDQSECEYNGGTFDSSNCQCKCPSTRYGRNCAHNCENLPGVLECGITCGNGKTEIFLCYQSCGSCGQSVSRPYKRWMEEYPATDAHNFKVRAIPPNPSPPIPKDVKTSDLPDRGNCPNRETDYFCENIRQRHYCNDAISGPRWKHYCAGSCNSCGNKEWANEVKKALKAKANINAPTVPAASIKTTSTGWVPSGGGSSSGGAGGGGGGGGGGWTPTSGGGGWTPTGATSPGGGGWAPVASLSNKLKSIIAAKNKFWSLSAQAKEPATSDGWTPTSPINVAIPDDWTTGWTPGTASGGWDVNAAVEEPGKSSGGSKDEWKSVGKSGDGWAEVGDGVMNGNGWTT